jgi:hypothetical protein
MSFEQTINYKKFQCYQEIKNSFGFHYQGIDLGKVLASDLFGLIVFDSTAKLRDYYFWPFLRLDVSKFIIAFKLKDVVFSTLYNSRKDHKELLEKIQGSTSNSCSVEITPHKKKFLISPKVFLLNYYKVFKNKKLSILGFKNRLMIFSRAIYYCHQIEELNNRFRGINLSQKKYIPFISSVGIEALLTLFFNQKGVETFHIFHGIFGRYKHRIANDIINGENICAKKILAFSESIKLDLIRDFNLNSERIFIAGNPKYPCKNINVNTRFRKCIVLNGFGFYDNDFIHLIKLLNKVSIETGMQFDIKPHPNSDILLNHVVKECKSINFLSKTRTLSEIFETTEYDFAITFNTVTYYECMYYNLISFRYNTNENIDFIGLSDKFSNYQDLFKTIDYFKSINIDKINIMITQLLREVLGMGINNYDNIINKMN